MTGPSITAAAAYATHHLDCTPTVCMHDEPGCPAESLSCAETCRRRGYHNRNCEPPLKLCCGQCSEVAHPGDLDGSVCIAPDLSRVGPDPTRLPVERLPPNSSER